MASVRPITSPHSADPAEPILGAVCRTAGCSPARRQTLEDVIEPYLLQNAFVTRTRQGRRATQPAYKHLGLKWKPPQQQGFGDDAGLFGKGEDVGDEKDDWKDDRKPKGTR